MLLSVVRTSDDALRLYLLKSLTELVSVLRQHVRKYLGDLMALVHHYWASGSQLLPVILTLVSEISGAALTSRTCVVKELHNRRQCVTADNESPGILHSAGVLPSVFCSVTGHIKEKDASSLLTRVLLRACSVAAGRREAVSAGADCHNFTKLFEEAERTSRCGRRITAARRTVSCTVL